MDDGWKYALEGVEHGPVPLQEILRLLTAGAIGLRTQVSWSKAPEWMPLSAVEIIREQVLAALKARSAAPAADASSAARTRSNKVEAAKTQSNKVEAGKTQSNKTAAGKTQSNVIPLSTAANAPAAAKEAAKPSAAAKETARPPSAAKEAAKDKGASAAGERVPAKLGRRLAADALDAVIVGGTLFLLSLAYQSWFGFSDANGLRSSALAGAIALALLSTWLYCAVLECSAQQGTLGKIALDLKVTDVQGRRLSFLRASARFAARLLSACTLGAGLLLPLLTRRRQALHDLVAGSLVG